MQWLKYFSVTFKNLQKISIALCLLKFSKKAYNSVISCTQIWNSTIDWKRLLVKLFIAQLYSALENLSKYCDVNIKFLEALHLSDRSSIPDLNTVQATTAFSTETFSMASIFAFRYISAANTKKPDDDDYFICSPLLDNEALISAVYLSKLCQLLELTLSDLLGELYSVPNEFAAYS